MDDPVEPALGRTIPTLPGGWPVTFFLNCLCFVLLLLLSLDLDLAVSLVQCIKNTTLKVMMMVAETTTSIDCCFYFCLCCLRLHNFTADLPGECIGETWSRTNTHVTVLVVLRFALLAGLCS